MIRKETGKDYKLTEAVVEKAFQNEEHSDHREQFLVARLRKSDVTGRNYHFGIFAVLSQNSVFSPELQLFSSPNN